MKKLFSILTACAFVAAPVFAQNMRKHTDRKGGFTIQHPGNWKKQTNQDGVNLVLSSKDDLANIQVISSEVEAGTSTAAFLTQVEQAAGPGHNNIIPETDRSAGAEDLTKMNIEEGTLGAYQIDQDGAKINQMIMAMRKGTTMFSVIITFADQASDKYKDVCTKIGDSFKSLK